MVMIGVDPHKGSHTAVALDGDESELARLRVKANVKQCDQLLAWAEPFGPRVWAIESAGGVGYLLAQQLVAAGEDVFDVPATLSARARLLDSRRSDKNDPNDARAAGIAALRSPGLTVVTPANHTEVLRLLGKRNRDLASARTRSVCRLHALVTDLVPGGIAKTVHTGRTAGLLAGLQATTPVQQQRLELAVELLADIERIDTQLRESKARIATAVTASGTGLTDIFGIGPIAACILIGGTGDIGRFASRHHFAAYNGTAPREVSSGGRNRHRLSRRGNRQLNYAIHIAAISQIRFAHTEGRKFYERKVAESHTGKEAIRALKRRISDVVYRQLVADAQRLATDVGPGRSAN
jgi:transposase